MRKMSYILILVGILIVLSPWLIEWKADQEQNELLQQAENNIKNKQQPMNRTVNTQQPGEFDQVSQLLDQGEDVNAENTDSEASGEENKNLIGTITISSIDVKLPILEGATKDNMRHSAVHLSDTSWFGEVGNTAIAAHRAHTKGRLFNRLNEVAEGDSILIRADGKEYTYKVFKKWVVEPTEVSVLQPDGKHKILTLITCDPLINPTHRLIVQAREE